ncbi:FkbM family methyltransferase [Acuticoccus sp. MNP-M23]|uniref:FkbM family methyltransferase n=1 Tax=Acuticoccus sp. MNP-M23 TaxID=3072793 RepID=UPI0028152E2B|nr:FkbM family methyltransferase [Acuticoccus sp. MNP-M23]WMS41514.1 FkbM family methyltransferase [Acuticoccus sp. MNP-M23]
MNLLKFLKPSSQQASEGRARSRRRGSNETPVFTMTVDGRAIRFGMPTAGTRRFFIPRYEDGRIHEAGATKFFLNALKPDSVFLDIGANLGYFSMVAAGVAHKVYAVEAQEFMVGVIRANAELNEYTNVTALCAAAGDSPALVTMPVAGRPSTGIGDHDEGLTVPVIRIDDYFKALAPTVIKIDVEGFELNVLKGMEEILKTGPSLAIELHKRMVEFGATPKAVFELLSDHGYTLRVGEHRDETLSLNELGGASLTASFNNKMVFCDRPSGVA